MRLKKPPSSTALSATSGRSATTLPSSVTFTVPIFWPLAIGTVKVMLDGKVVAQRPLVALNAVEEGGFFKRMWDELMMWWES